ncbi:MAG: hypothetical protein Q8865_08530 [Bacillota bacterium]|nr:hypothetical protein [Bacillota bacterium]
MLTDARKGQTDEKQAPCCMQIQQGACYVITFAVPVLFVQFEALSCM